MDRAGDRRRAEPAHRRRAGRLLLLQRDHRAREAHPGDPQLHAPMLPAVLLRHLRPGGRAPPRAARRGRAGAQPLAGPPLADRAHRRRAAAHRPEPGRLQEVRRAAGGRARQPRPVEPPPRRARRRGALGARLPAAATRRRARRPLRDRRQPGDRRRASLPARAVVAADRQGDPRRHPRRAPPQPAEPRAGAPDRGAGRVLRHRAPGRAVATNRADHHLEHRARLAVPAAGDGGLRPRRARAAGAGGVLRGPGGGGARPPPDRRAAGGLGLLLRVHPGRGGDRPRQRDPARRGARGGARLPRRAHPRRRALPLRGERHRAGGRLRRAHAEGRVRWPQRDPLGGWGATAGAARGEGAARRARGLRPGDPQRDLPPRGRGRRGAPLRSRRRGARRALGIGDRGAGPGARREARRAVARLPRRAQGRAPGAA